VKISSLSEVIVSATRASEKSGMAFNNVSKSLLNKNNLAQDLPFLLQNLPSVVASSDAGAGVGYSGMRIRGTDPTRINVTINGIPFNDSESQGVYWVNMPDIASSTTSIQVQRGVGASTNGAGAFGGTVNLNTLSYAENAGGNIQSTLGSFGTLKNSISLNTGKLGSGFMADARLSTISSNGFVDRASADLKSYYVSGTHYHKSNFVRLNVFSGKETTYQAWNGIPQSLSENNQTAFQKYIERNFIDEDTKNDMIGRGRRYNSLFYANEVDNYQQTHYQAISSFEFKNKWRLNPSFHYTKGKGYFEQYKSDQKLENYGVSPYKIGEKEVSETNLIRRKWLDNDFYGVVWSLESPQDQKINLSFGGGANTYMGGHYGNIIWAEYAQKISSDYEYYLNNSVKNDINNFAKVTIPLKSKLFAYLDLQHRYIDFSMKGTADALQVLDYEKKYHFLNPKIGLTYMASPENTFFLSYAKGSKEPSRQDFVDNAPNVPKPEILHDFETGYKLNRPRLKAEVNLYNMAYQNQLVLTGAINGVGEAIRINVPQSFRRGIELQGQYGLSPKLSVAGNLTLSKNKIKQFSETVVSYDETPNEINVLKKADIAFSPNAIAGLNLAYLPLRSLSFSWFTKHVGSQHLDNTSSDTKKLKAYTVSDLNVTFSPNQKIFSDFKVVLLINNVLNKKYDSNGYTYSYIFEEKITENFVFPQAGTNFLLSLKLGF
jgi:iron complex outermembrane recepter protein